MEQLISLFTPLKSEQKKSLADKRNVEHSDGVIKIEDDEAK